MDSNFEKEDKNKYFGRRVAITGGIILGDLLLLLKLAGVEVTDSSGSYSDIPIVSDFYIKRSQQ